MTRRSHPGRYLRARGGPLAHDAHRLTAMRVRAFELRLIAVALVVCWAVAAGLVLLAYRPGGPLDIIVGLTAMTPIAIALAGAIWPPVARGNVAFPVIVGLGVLALLCLVPSIAGVVTQLLAFGSRTLLPSLEAIYPWLLALLATSLFSGFGIARRLEGGTALRRRRLLSGVGIALIATAVSGVLFATIAVANELALRDTPPASSRFGPTSGDDQLSTCDAPLAAGQSARLSLHLNATVDLRPLGSTDLAGIRVGDDFRWLAYVAANRQLGQYGSARIGDRAWTTSPGSRWAAVAPSVVTDDAVDIRALEVALTPGLSRDRRGPRDGGHRGRPNAPVPGRDRRPDVPSRVSAGGLDARRRRSRSLARPARLLGLPRRPDRPDRRQRQRRCRRYPDALSGDRPRSSCRRRIGATNPRHGAARRANDDG